MQTQIKFDYNKPIHKDLIKVISYSDNGKQRKTGFIYQDEYFVLVYNYGANYGFKFIFEYPSKEAFEKPLSITGEKMIYSSTLQSNCTDFGNYLEYSLTKNDALKNAKELSF